MTAQAIAAVPPLGRVRSAVPPLLLVGGIAVAVVVGLRASGWYQQAVLTLALCALAWIGSFDSHSLRAPNKVVYPLALAVILAPFALGLDRGLTASGGALFSFGLLLVAVVASRGAMGYGDAKVGFVCGALLGVGGIVPFMLATFALGGLFAGVMLSLRLRGRKDVVAFTPFLFAGAVVVLVLGGSSVYLPATG